MAPKKPHFTPKAKSVIFLFMYGGRSHVDTFRLQAEAVPARWQDDPGKTFGRGGKKNQGRASARSGSSSPTASAQDDLGPLPAPRAVRRRHGVHPLHVRRVADHGSAMLMMNSAASSAAKPVLGSWATYGLAASTRTCRLRRHARQDRWPDQRRKELASGYIAAAYQASSSRRRGTPIHNSRCPGHDDAGAAEAARPPAREERRTAATRADTATQRPHRLV